MRAAKAKAAVLHPKEKDVEVEAKEKAPDLPPAKDEGGTRTQRRLQPPRPSPHSDPSKRKVRPPRKPPRLTYPGECSYCGIYGHQARDCRKRIYAKSKKTQRQTNDSVTAKRVTFDADEDDLTGSEPDDETATLFQAVLTVESDDEADSTQRDPTPLKLTSWSTRPKTTKKGNTIPKSLMASAPSVIVSSSHQMVLRLLWT
jgi:hypothetical protein